MKTLFPVMVVLLSASAFAYEGECLPELEEEYTHRDVLQADAEDITADHSDDDDATAAPSSRP
jgi:hypothetical protein